MGDLLLIATGGVTEVCDAAGQELGIERVQSLLIEQTHKPLQVIATEILDAAARWGRQIDAYASAPTLEPLLILDEPSIRAGASPNRNSGHFRVIFAVRRS